jgi:N-carbamoyl-L-amino-acid hydrolase
MAGDLVLPERPNAAAIAAAERIDQERLWTRLMELATHGATEAGGVNRQALSQEDIAARALLRSWGAEVGLEASLDAIGNLFLRLPGKVEDAAPVLSGSHLDSQPTGGKFDGAYGVLAALEAVEAMQSAGIEPSRPVEIVAWTNEEGSRFAPGMMGSTVYAGARELDSVLAVRDGGGITVGEALARVLDAEGDVPRRQLGGRPAAFIEAHIEQGPVLEAAGKTVGVVRGIEGKRVFRITVTGKAGHAGTVPQRERQDAVIAAAAMVTAIGNAVTASGPDAKFTAGMFNVHPNAPSVIPAKVQFSVDLRHTDGAELSALGDGIVRLCGENGMSCEVDVNELSHDAPLDFPQPMRAFVGASSDALGIPAMDVFSGAGHDARHLHYVCLTGMIFVPSRGGVSHSEEEWTEPGHLADGARVLAAVVATLAAV